ncbi:MAG: hypothetical protein JWL89_529 [Candidatus Saccharibacteria bacterium]|nr:hypothetical protein [Candidatus Saccharibacteria bacterium]
MSDLRSSLLGQYEVSSELADPDCVIGFSFGTDTSMQGVNYRLAISAMACGDRATDYGYDANVPTLMERMLFDALPEWAEPSYVIETPISDTSAKQGGTWEVLRNAKAYMDEEGLSRPFLVAHAFLVGRVAAQAVMQGMQPVVRGGLPRHFDWSSQQWWTKHQALWIPREYIGQKVLKRRGQL